MSLRAAFVVVAALFSVAASDEPAVPLRSGTHKFEFRDAEFAHLSGIAVLVTIQGRKVKVISSDRRSKLYPKGAKVDEGLLLWNRPTRQWIISNDAADRDLKDVGGCSEGPRSVDFKSRIIWGCESG